MSEIAWNGPASHKTGCFDSADGIGKTLSAVIVFLLFAAAIFTSKQGADAPEYYYWQQYFSRFDVNALYMFPKSRTGVPLVQHQYGSGLLAAIPNILFNTKPTGMFGTGAFLGFANMSMFLLLARRYFANREDTLLAAAGFLLFTPAIYYLNAYSTEGWTIFLSLAGLCCIEWCRADVRKVWYCTVSLAVVFHFLLLVRSVNIILCAALGAIFLADVLGYWVSRFGIRAAVVRVLAAGALLALGCGLAVWFLGSLNQIVNGSFWLSPYSFHDEQFSALSLSRAMFGEVLLSAWHGLVPYHPILLCAIVWLIVTRSRDIVSLAVIAAFVLQLLLQGSWYGWWMGLNTFGARAFCGVGVLIAYVFMRDRPGAPVLREMRPAFTILMVVFATYEAWLVGQAITNYTDYGAFVGALSSQRSLTLFGLFAIWGLLAFSAGRYAGLAWEQRALVYVLGLYVLCLLPSVAYSQAALDAVRARAPMLLGIVGLMVAGYALSLNARVRESATKAFETASRAAGGLLFGALVFALLISIYAQVAMLRNFAASAGPAKLEVPAFLCGEPSVTLQEYDLIKGYDAEKRALKAFLQRNGCLDE